MVPVIKGHQELNAGTSVSIAFELSGVCITVDTAVSPFQHNECRWQIILHSFLLQPQLSFFFPDSALSLLNLIFSSSGLGPKLSSFFYFLFLGNLINSRSLDLRTSITKVHAYSLRPPSRVSEICIKLYLWHHRWKVCKDSNFS